MPRRLYRCYGLGYLHFITSSCYQRRPFLNTARRRTLFVKILEAVRRRYDFVMVGFVVMPEHIHLIISEPERDTPSTVMQVLKQRFARQVLQEGRKRMESRPRLWQEEFGEGHVWQPRFYDFVLWTKAKRVEKLRYIHRNPVNRGLVLESEQWDWSSYRHYAFGERGLVLVNEPQSAPMRVRSVIANGVKATG